MQVILSPQHAESTHPDVNDCKRPCSRRSPLGKSTPQVGIRAVHAARCREPHSIRQSTNASTCRTLRRHDNADVHLEADNTAVNHGNCGGTFGRLDIAVFTCIVT